MPNILCFSRNRCNIIEQVDDQTIRSTCRVQDNLMDASVQIMVKIPNLDVVQIKCEISRLPKEEDLNVQENLQRFIGTRVGPGVKKIIWSIVEHLPYAEQFATLVEECCNGVILSFTKDVLINAPNDKQGEQQFFANMVRANPRLFNSCAALSSDSPLMDTLELDKG